MNYRVFGDMSNSNCNCNLTPNAQQGKTLAHEVGHYLGLRHTFEGGCHDTSGINNQILGDKVVDTPPSQGNFGCPTNIDSCIEATNNQADDISNYMDYTYDTCKNHFTTGQKDRMIFHLINYRTNLYDVDNLIYTGTCNSQNLTSSDFTASLSNTGNDYIYNICAGNTLYFKPTVPSSNYPVGSVSYLWDFGNGNTSTLENSSFTYSTSSTDFYKVKLTVTRNSIVNETEKNIFVNNCAPIVNNESTLYFSWKNSLKFDSGVPITNGIINFPGVGFNPPSSPSDHGDNTFQSINMQSDEIGNVLFFTDGLDVYSGSNPNARINNDYLIGTGNAFNGLQGNVILKSPVANSTQYFIIHKKSVAVNNFHPQSYSGFRYSIVNVNNGVPTMTSNNLNIPIVSNATQTGFRTSPFDGALFGGNSVQAIEKNNGGGYWIITSLLKSDG